MAKTPREKGIDRLLTSYIVNECVVNFDIHSLSETKLQKLVFLSENKLIRAKSKGFNYSYIKFLHGPFSSDLRSDLVRLSGITFIKEPYLMSTRSLRHTIMDFNEVFERNQSIMTTIDNILDEWAPLPLKEILKRVYRMRWGRTTIGKLPHKTPMLWKMKVKQAKEVFSITSDEHEDLSLCFDPKIAEVLKPAFNDMRKGRLISYEATSREL